MADHGRVEDRPRSSAICSARREDAAARPVELAARVVDPAAEAEHADGRALLIVLDTLVPAERVAFAQHDLFGME